MNLLVLLKDAAGTAQLNDETCSSVCDSRINRRLRAQVKQVSSLCGLHLFEY